MLTKLEHMENVLKYIILKLVMKDIMMRKPCLPQLDKRKKYMNI